MTKLFFRLVDPILILLLNVRIVFREYRLTRSYRKNEQFIKRGRY